MIACAPQRGAGDGLARNHTPIRARNGVSAWDVDEVSLDAFVRDLEAGSTRRGSSASPCSAFGRRRRPPSPAPASSPPGRNHPFLEDELASDHFFEESICS
jgi:hypothetical protein